MITVVIEPPPPDARCTSMLLIVQTFQKLYGLRLQVPVLVLEAGLDRLVRSDGIARFRRRLPQARYRLFDGAYHDLFDETDDIRREAVCCRCFQRVFGAVLVFRVFSVFRCVGDGRHLRFSIFDFLSWRSKATLTHDTSSSTL